VTRGQALGIAFGARRVLRQAGEISHPALQEALDDYASQGLRYLAVLGPEDTILAAVGKRHVASIWRAGGSIGPLAAVFFADGGASARVAMRYLGVVSPENGQSANASAQPGREENHPLHGKQMILEVESTTAHSLIARARASLVVGLLAAAVLLGLAGIFWRISRHAERASILLEHDRQLKLLGQMSAVLGHEIKNPLASLKGHAQLLLEKLPANHIGRKGAETVLRETIRLEELSRQVLEFARTGSVSCKSEDPVVIVGKAVQGIGDADVKLDVRGGPATWFLDAARMEEVLENLLRNARDASPAGQSVDVLVDICSDEQLIFEVRDRGEGIVPGEEERVFEPFYTRRAKGTGLGLPLARRIVEGHGGTITARNHPEGGAVFRVSLPAHGQGV
jgi:two-component system sensor histidine kinase HydH